MYIYKQFIFIYFIKTKTCKSIFYIIPHINSFYANISQNIQLFYSILHPHKYNIFLKQKQNKMQMLLVITEFQILELVSSLSCASPSIIRDAHPLEGLCQSVKTYTYVYIYTQQKPIHIHIFLLPIIYSFLLSVVKVRFKGSLQGMLTLEYKSGKISAYSMGCPGKCAERIKGDRSSCECV